MKNNEGPCRKFPIQHFCLCQRSSFLVTSGTLSHLLLSFQHQANSLWCWAMVGLVSACVYKWHTWKCLLEHNEMKSTQSHPSRRGPEALAAGAVVFRMAVPLSADELHPGIRIQPRVATSDESRHRTTHTRDHWSNHPPAPFPCTSNQPKKRYKHTSTERALWGVDSWCDHLHIISYVFVSVRSFVRVCEMSKGGWEREW